MNTGEQLPEGEVQSQGSQREENKQHVLQQQAQKTDHDRTVTRPGQGTWKSEVVPSGLEKALDALVKAQDHLNTAADQSSDGLSKMIEGINRSLRGLQREVAQVIYRLGHGR